MLKATATWSNGQTLTERFFKESERVVWVSELKMACEEKKLSIPTIVLWDDSDEPRKKVWGRIGMSAELTDYEFDILQCGNRLSEVLLHNLIETGRLRLDGESYFPETADEGFHEIGNEINLSL